MKNIVIIGAGGFALEVMDLINSINLHNNQFTIVGFLDDSKTGFVVDEHKIIGKTSDLHKFKDCKIVIAITNPITREKYFTILDDSKMITPNLIHPNAEISIYAKIKENSGVIVNSFAQVSAKSILNRGVIIDSNVYIGHESEIDNFATIYPSSSISGNTRIGHHTEIGLGSKIIQGLTIGSNTFVGAGSTVVNDLPNNVIAVGTPCKTIKER
jgi:sugar O-acyltransferase (sialic acid O-acetyltransferase NeuD family)